MNYDDLKLNNQICHRLYIASNGITRLYRPYLKELGLTYPQYVILMALWELDGVNLGELAKKTRIDKGFLTGILKKMVNNKLLVLSAFDGDQRVKIVKLTKKGLKLKDKAVCIPQQIFSRLADEEVTEEDLSRFVNILDRINLKINEF